jgi:hypothetical protein
MAKKRRPSYLSRSVLMSKEDYEDYKRYKSDIQKRKYEEDLKKLKSRSKSEQKQERYQKSRTGKVSRFFTKGAEVGKRGVTRSLYNQNRYSKVQRTGKRGRPKGTVKYTDPRTGQPIGVYEHRKILAHRHRMERAEYLRSRALSPEQKEVLERIERRKQMLREAPERRTIPDSHGTFNLRDYFNEIDESANLVG